MKNKTNIIYLLFGRNIRGSRPRAQTFRYQILIIISLFTILVLLIYRYVDNNMLPIAMAISKMKAQTLSTQLINKAVTDTIRENNINADDLITYYYNKEGEISSCGVDTVLINKICGGVSEKLSFENNEYNKNIYIPFGNIAGKSIFTNWGPNIKANVRPYGTVKLDYGRQFESVGINQVNYRVWLDVQISLQIVVPLDSDKITVSQQVTLVDRLINGKVPESYVDVPYDNILDVAP